MKKVKTVFAVIVLVFAVGSVAHSGMIFNVHVNVNKASYDELLTIPFVCSEIAMNMIEFRNANGPFKSIDDLMKVKGVTTNILEQMKPYITLENGPEN